MANDQQVPDRTTPGEDFVQQVKQALEHLYDFPYLLRHPLAYQFGPAEERPSETAGQQLRRELIGAIESLDPGPSVSFRAPPARLYNLLHLHYVGGMTVQEAAHELGISKRQAYRDLRHGEESVAAMLWARRSPASSREPRASQLSSVQAEMARLEPHPRPTDVRELLRQAQKAVEQLASQRRVALHAEVPPEPVIISIDPVVAQQVLVSALSSAVQQARPGDLHLELATGAETVSLTFCYQPALKVTDAPLVDGVVGQLVERLEWRVDHDEQPQGARTVTLHMVSLGPTVLVIDDNEGLVELLSRYLADHACRVMPAASGQEGLKLTQELAPDAVILDIMMPEMDGWEVLQRLRTLPQTTDTPVIICSVFDDPGLAQSLGASLFLHKPVSRDDVLSALRQLDIV